MPRVKKSLNRENYRVRIFEYVDFDDPAFVRDLKYKFNLEKLAGKIKSDFDDEIWVVKDEGNPQSVHFSYDREKYEKYFARRISEKQFNRYLREYALYYYDYLDFRTWINRIHGLIKDIEESNYFRTNISFQGNETSFRERKRVFMEFLELLPIEQENLLYQLQQTEVVAPLRNEAAETLCEFLTYCIHDYELDRFWSSEMSEKDRMFYTPYYILWKIDTIVCQRPEELCLTPYDCIEYINGKPWFTRIYGDIKGHDSDQAVFHSMKDFKSEQIPIPEDLASVIVKYREFRSKYPNNGFLFSTDVLKECNPGNATSYAEYFDADHLCQIRDWFYINYLEKKRGYEVINKSQLDMDSFDRITEPFKRIIKIQNRDARHIAIINLLRNNCSVASALRITHHSDPTMLLHYGNNVEQFEKAYVAVCWNRIFEKENIVENENESAPDYVSKSPATYEEASLVAKGKRSPGIDMGNCTCYSIKKYNGDMSDCYAAYIKRPDDPCLACGHSDLNEQTEENTRKIAVNVEKSSIGTITKCISISAEGEETLEDIGEALRTFSDASRLVRIMEVKKRKYAT